MACPRGRYHLTYPGEIYHFREIKDELAGLGHRFASTGDSEVLLAAYAQWGAGCLPRLRGMFAFAIWDQEDKTLFAARDRLGIKPLYYRERGGELLLASEPKALLAHPACGRGVDPAGLRDFLVHGYLPAPRSIYRELRQLPPAGWLRLAGGRLAIGRYWDPAFAADPAPDEAAWRARLNQALDDAVASHLVSDVPVGAFLSGGIDSSAVVAALGAAGAAQAVQAFCVGFEEGEFDERAKARRVAAHLGVSLTEIVARAPGLAADLDLIAGVYDEPFGDYSALPTLHLCRATADRVKVALSGDGGDGTWRQPRQPPRWRRAADRRLAGSTPGRPPALSPTTCGDPCGVAPAGTCSSPALPAGSRFLETASERRRRRAHGADVKLLPPQRLGTPRRRPASCAATRGTTPSGPTRPPATPTCRRWTRRSRWGFWSPCPAACWPRWTGPAWPSGWRSGCRFWTTGWWSSAPPSRPRSR